MKTSEVVQSLEFSPQYNFINIGTTDGFRLIPIDARAEVNTDRLRGRNEHNNSCQYFCIEKGSILNVQNINNYVVYVRGGTECPGQELYIYDDYHDRDASKILFSSKIKTVKLSTTK